MVAHYIEKKYKAIDFYSSEYVAAVVGMYREKALLPCSIFTSFIPLTF